MNAPWLSIHLPDGSTQTFVLKGEKWLVGRSPDASLSLPWSQISRAHAHLHRRGAQIWLQDNHSRNGVFLNGQRLEESPVLLSDGDVIVLAGVVELRFHDPGETMLGPAAGRLQGVWLDPNTDDVWVDGNRVEPPLSLHQMRLLRALYQQPGLPLSFQQIKQVVWPDENLDGISKQALDSLIKRLRQRLRAASPGSNAIRVVRGYGLKLEQ